MMKPEVPVVWVQLHPTGTRGRGRGRGGRSSALSQLSLSRVQHQQEQQEDKQRAARRSKVTAVLCCAELIVLRGETSEHRDVVDPAGNRRQKCPWTESDDSS
ncbi:hypothetical protein EYF80_062230 [Liparis tanakae]|uniref:Uncharacterized protein n=1 Tax=Liparis tanakae TaxID=230148 RepID=A0A4Z2EFS1_9TELE|nr:hypothetical protein EYF80_062230 [Liparis tanakae]